jgi:hypothetical protein
MTNQADQEDTALHTHTHPNHMNEQEEDESGEDQEPDADQEVFALESASEPARPSGSAKVYNGGKEVNGGKALDDRGKSEGTRRTQNQTASQPQKRALPARYAFCLFFACLVEVRIDCVAPPQARFACKMCGLSFFGLVCLVELRIRNTLCLQDAGFVFLWSDLWHSESDCAAPAEARFACDACSLPFLGLSHVHELVLTQS